MFPSPQGGSETELAELDPRLAIVSIPSRRVGDNSSSFGGSLRAAVSIPSRRVGDLKSAKLRRNWRRVSIPSRRVGDMGSLGTSTAGALVSIPSRRVGDAGKTNPSALTKFLVSIPSRRVGDTKGVAALLPMQPSFHPLKAGRRPSPPLSGRSP